MPTYVILIRLTEQGIRNVKDTTKRARAFEAEGAKVGVKVRDIYWTMGRFDGVIIVEAPDDETLSRLILRSESLGSARTETVRAFSTKEMGRVLKGIP